MMDQPWYKLLMNLLVMSLVCVCVSSASLASPVPSAEGIQVYQKNLHLSPEHKQNLADDITRYRNADNLWDVMREEFTLNHYENNPLVQEKVEWYMNNQDFLLRSASRAAPYLYYILQQVKKRHLPAELVLLPIIESGYNPFATSNVGAVGIWQIMPDTASGLGVRQDWWYDGRRDVITSTRAALNYLAYLQSFFDGNWLLAIAAYNTGEGNVLAALRRNIRDGRDTEFWSLPLAQQTRDYVPSLLALATIISHPNQYPIYFPPVRNAPYLGQVDVGTQINLKYAASLAGLSYKKMIQLNPGFNRSTISSKGPYKLVLPIENVEQFSENLARTPMNTNVLQWMHYKVKTGDTLALIAKRYGTTTSSIRKLNHLSKNSVRHGTNLLIPTMGKPASSDDYPDTTPLEVAQAKPAAKIISRNIASSEKTTKYTLQPGDTIYMARLNDSVDKIAKRFHISSYSLRAANQIRGSYIKSGKQLIIPTHAVTTELASRLSSNRLQPGDTIYMVRRGDTIDKIAKRFRTSPSSIRLANLVDDTSLLEGLRIVIPTHLRT